MIVKHKPRSTEFNYVKSFPKKVTDFFRNRKIKILLSVLKIGLFILIGMLIGLFIFGFFGTLDNPSPTALNIAHSMGISGLTMMKDKISGVMDENIKIPLNYIIGQSSNPNKIYLDISFTDYEKIRMKREEALKMGQLITDSEDYVPAVLKYNNENIKIKLRLKGDFLDHLSGNKWSFRIKVEENDKTLKGMTVFSIQDPKTRQGLNEFIHFQSLKNEGVIAPRYEFIQVYINGENKGIYALEEHFQTELIENNGARAGVILKFNEDPSWGESFQKENYFSSTLALDQFRDEKFNWWFYGADIDSFENEKIFEDPVLSAQFEKAKNLLNLFREGKIETHEAFDTSKLAKYFALEALNGCGHGSRWPNIRFYYNPVISKLEPIGYDGDCWKSSDVVIDKFQLAKEDSVENYYLFFNDPVFLKEYMRELERVSSEGYVDNLFSKINEEVKRNLNIIHKDNPVYHFSYSRYYSNQKKIQDKLFPIKTVNAYFYKAEPSKGTILIHAGNLENMPVQLLNVVFNGTDSFEAVDKYAVLYPRRTTDTVNYTLFEFQIPSGFSWERLNENKLVLNYQMFGLDEIRNVTVSPWPYCDIGSVQEDAVRKKVDINSFNLIRIDESSMSVYFKEGSWGLNESLVIPPGYIVYAGKNTTIDLTNGAMILSYSPIEFIGNAKFPILIYSSDGLGQGLTVLKAKVKMDYVIFSNLTYPLTEEWQLMGGVNIYESEVLLNHVTFEKSNSEDGLNIIRSRFTIENSKFQNSASDCFDSDFSTGTVENSSFLNCGNDGIDFGGSTGNVSNVFIYNAGDKAISSGEKSNIMIKNLIVDGTATRKIGIAVSSKDSSVIFIENAVISGAKYGVAVYQKKPEFGPATVDIKNISMTNIEEEYLIEENSAAKIDDISLIGHEIGVYEKLYGAESGEK